MNDLEKKIIAVEVKAKKTSYLNSIAGKFKIRSNAANDAPEQQWSQNLPQMSNLNKDLRNVGVVH